jgi:hypothetical protein
MKFRILCLALAAGSMLGSGCKKPEASGTVALTPASRPIPLAQATQTIARIHWVGLKQLALETNAASWMELWKLPESLKLETRTLDRLSLAPWPLLGRVPDTNAAALLRPLLDDLIQEESYVEVRQSITQSNELALAIRLNDGRAALWQTNLAAVLESLTAIATVPQSGGRAGWSLAKHQAPNRIELVRTNGWSVLGASEGLNDLLEEIVAGIGRNGTPFPTTPADNWLDADVDLRRVLAALSIHWDLPQDWPRISLALNGKGRLVQTHGELEFRKPIPLELESWNVPTNLMGQPLSSFTAVQGIKSWVASTKAWNDLEIGAPPNQIFSWGRPSYPMMTYFAAPMPNASNAVDHVSSLVVENGAPWFATHPLVNFQRSQEFNGLQWTGLPYLSPFLKSIATGGEDFAFAGLGPWSAAETRLPSDILHELLGRTNLVYYGWETTGLRSEQWIYIAQYFRFVSIKAQLPPDGICLAWIRAIEPKLGNTLTEVVRTGPGRLSFVRQSSLGLTGVELQLLTDWLESPQFPIGLNTVLAKPPDM